MMTIEELHSGGRELAERIAHLHEFLKIEERTEELAALEAKMSAPDFWNDKESAQATVGALSSCRNVLEPFRKLEVRSKTIPPCWNLPQKMPTSSPKRMRLTTCCRKTWINLKS